VGRRPSRAVPQRPDPLRAGVGHRAAPV